MSGTSLFARPIYWLLILALVLSLALAVPVGSKVSAAPSEVWVDDDYCDGCYNDGHTWGYDAFARIQDGIDKVKLALPATVHVAAGNYSGAIVLHPKLQLLGAGADVTTIDGAGVSGDVVWVPSAGPDTKLDGFTITNGKRGIDLSTSSPVISNCRFVGNNSVGLHQAGGGMYNNYSSPTVTNCTFSGNSVDNSGGGMHNNYSSPAVTNCTFSDNLVSWYGGGMSNAHSSPTVTNCVFSDNRALYVGSGAGMSNDFASSPNVTNCVFWGNYAIRYGGGMYNLNNSSPTVTNCIFDGNSAEWYGGGMYSGSGSSPSVTNCVFDGNSAEWYGGGMYSQSSSSPNVKNCILVNNSAGLLQGGGLYAGASHPIDYNDVWNNSGGSYGGSCSPGSNDISVDPMFFNPAAQDFHLMSGSPCIDAGTNDGAPGEDMDGNHRPIDGNGDGTATTDMGAYEYVLASVEFSATPTMGPTPLEVRFSDETPGDIDTWSWDFGDGGTSSEQNPTHVYTLPGPFTVSLIVSGPSGGGMETKVDYIWPYTQGVGGEAYPVSKLAILAPWIALAALLLGGTSWLVLRRRRA